MKVARDYSAAEAKSINESVANKLAKWTADGNYGTYEAKIKKLKFEIFDYFEGNMGNVQGKYKTWKVAQDAYKKELSKVERDHAIDLAKDEIEKVKKYAASATGKKKIKAFARDLDALSKAKNFDLDLVRETLEKANQEIGKLEAERIKLEAAKYANNGSGLWNGGKAPYTPEEIVEKQRLEEELWDKIKAANGRYTSTVRAANERYADYIHSLSDKYYGKQVSQFSAEQIQELQEFISKYLAETPQNPHYVWGADVGGIYSSRISAREDFAKILNNVTADELSVITRFTNGMTFCNAYNLKGTSAFWRRMWNDKISSLSAAEIKDMERIIEEYTQAVSGILDKMKRYDGVVFRGLHGEGSREVLKDCIKAWDDGTKVWTTYGPASTSTSLEVAHQFDGDLIMKIKNKTGAWIQPVSEYSYELEVMVKRYDKYRLLCRPYQMDGKWWIELEEIV